MMERTVAQYREIAFDRYLSSGFRENNGAVLANSRHYAFNYLRFLPEPKSAPILDIGCGMGDFLSCLKENGYTNFVGVDVGREQVEHCQALVGSDRAILVESSIDFLAGHRNYSCISMLNVIEHMQKDEIVAVLRQIRECLAPGGVLILKTDNLGCITGTFNRYFDFTHEVGFVEPSLRQVLRLAGFTRIQFLQEKVPPPYTLRTRLWLVLVWFYRRLLRVAYEFERRGNVMPSTWGKDLTAIVWK